MTIIDAARRLTTTDKSMAVSNPEWRRIVAGLLERIDFQERVRPWLLACFGTVIAGDKTERNHRFLEEAIELVQACGCTTDEAHQLVDYVYGRTIGERNQEVGGVMVTLAALCLAQDLSMHDAGETELTRCWEKIERVRAKQSATPKHSPLPGQPTPASTATERPARCTDRGWCDDEIACGEAGRCLYATPEAEAEYQRLCAAVGVAHAAKPNAAPIERLTAAQKAYLELCVCPIEQRWQCPEYVAAKWYHALALIIPVSGITLFAALVKDAYAAQQRRK